MIANSLNRTTFRQDCRNVVLFKEFAIITAYTNRIFGATDRIKGVTWIPWAASSFIPSILSSKLLFPRSLRIVTPLYSQLFKCRYESTKTTNKTKIFV